MKDRTTKEQHPHNDIYYAQGMLATQTMSDDPNPLIQKTSGKINMKQTLLDAGFNPSFQAQLGGKHMYASGITGHMSDETRKALVMFKMDHPELVPKKRWQEGEHLTHETLHDLTRVYQQQNGLKVTGKLDRETKASVEKYVKGYEHELAEDKIKGIVPAGKQAPGQGAGGSQSFNPLHVIQDLGVLASNVPGPVGVGAGVVSGVTGVAIAATENGNVPLAVARGVAGAVTSFGGAASHIVVKAWVAEAISLGSAVGSTIIANNGRMSGKTMALGVIPAAGSGIGAVSPQAGNVANEILGYGSIPNEIANLAADMGMGVDPKKVPSPQMVLGDVIGNAMSTQYPAKPRHKGEPETPNSGLDNITVYEPAHKGR